jgi:drug/metabolite transporter (DMT)-like permease
MNPALALTAVVLLTASGQIALKAGAARLVTGAGIARLLLSVSPPLILGLASALAAPVFYFAALRRVELGLAFAATGLAQAAVALGSRVLLGERLRPRHVAGTVLIVAGLLVWTL